MSNTTSWIKVFEDRNKLITISKRYSSRIKKLLQSVKGASRLQISLPGFLSYSIELKDTKGKIESEVQEFIKESLGKSMSVSEFVSNLTENNFKIDDIVSVRADIPFKERFRVTNPLGVGLPILKKGSYLALRPPFPEIVLADGIYTEAFLYSLRDNEAPGCNDMLLLAFRNSASPNIKQLLKNGIVIMPE